MHYKKLIKPFNHYRHTSITNVVSSNSAQVRWSRYNITW